MRVYGNRKCVHHGLCGLDLQRNILIKNREKTCSKLDELDTYKRALAWVCGRRFFRFFSA